MSAGWCETCGARPAGEFRRVGAAIDAERTLERWRHAGGCGLVAVFEREVSNELRLVASTEVSAASVVLREPAAVLDAEGAPEVDVAPEADAEAAAGVDGDAGRVGVELAPAIVAMASGNGRAAQLDAPPSLHRVELAEPLVLGRSADVAASADTEVGQPAAARRSEAAAEPADAADDLVIDAFPSPPPAPAPDHSGPDTAPDYHVVLGATDERDPLHLEDADASAAEVHAPVPREVVVVRRRPMPAVRARLRSPLRRRTDDRDASLFDREAHSSGSSGSPTSFQTDVDDDVEATS
ncbi:MAG: hypothetical protein OEY23_18300 [Acidimicrobiia bacterium]|nr:hypothetical protein [Acidimicrobiia bacterium]